MPRAAISVAVILIAITLISCTSSDSSAPSASPPAVSSDGALTSSPQDQPITPPPSTESASLTPTTSTSTSESPLSATTVLTPASDETPPWPSGLTPEDQQAAQSAIDLYSTMMPVLDNIQANPGVQDWTAEVRKYQGDPAATDTLTFIAQLVKANVHQTGTTGFRVWATSVTPISVELTICLNKSGLDYLDADGSSRYTRAEHESGFLSYATATKYDVEGWLISDIHKGEQQVPC